MLLLTGIRLAGWLGSEVLGIGMQSLVVEANEARYYSSSKLPNSECHRTKSSAFEAYLVAKESSLFNDSVHRRT